MRDGVRYANLIEGVIRFAAAAAMVAVALVLTMLYAAPSSPAAEPFDTAGFETNEGVVIKRVQVSDHLDKTRITLDLSGPINFDYQISAGGKTIVLLIPLVKWQAAHHLKLAQDSNLYRINFFPNRASGGGVLSILGRKRLALGEVFVLRPDKNGGHRVVLDLPYAQQDASLPDAGAIRYGRLLPPHADFPPILQQARRPATPVRPALSDRVRSADR